MAVIDAHAHIYPNKIASRAVDAVGDFYLIDMFGEGTVEHLLSAQQHAPITHFIVHSVATTPGSVESINNFIAEQCRQHPEFIGFMAMHQDYPEPEKEIERAIGLGLKGMKLHPDTQHVNMDDPRLMNVYEMIEGRLPIVIHTGDYRYDYSHPRRLMNVLKTFPDLVVDAAPCAPPVRTSQMLGPLPPLFQGHLHAGQTECRTESIIQGTALRWL